MKRLTRGKKAFLSRNLFHSLCKDNAGMVKQKQNTYPCNSIVLIKFWGAIEIIPRSSINVFTVEYVA